MRNEIEWNWIMKWNEIDEMKLNWMKLNHEWWNEIESRDGVEMKLNHKTA